MLRLERATQPIASPSNMAATTSCTASSGVAATEAGAMCHSPNQNEGQSTPQNTLSVRIRTSSSLTGDGRDLRATSPAERNPQTVDQNPRAYYPFKWDIRKVDDERDFIS